MEVRYYLDPDTGSPTFTVTVSANKKLSKSFAGPRRKRK